MSFLKKALKFISPVAAIAGAFSGGGDENIDVGVTEDQLSLSPDDIQRILGRMNATSNNLFSRRSQQLNETAARSGLPAATIEAMRRGAGIDLGQQLIQGGSEVQTRAALSRIDARRFIAQLRNQREIAEKQAKAQKNAALLGGITDLAAAGAGFFFGGPAGSAGAVQAKRSFLG